MNIPTSATYPAALTELTRLLFILAGMLLPFVINIIVRRTHRFELWFFLSPAMVLGSMALISLVDTPPNWEGYIHQFAIGFAFTPGTYIFFAIGFFFKRLTEMKMTVDRYEKEQ